MENSTRPQPSRRFHADAAVVEIYATREDAGLAAADDVAGEIVARQHADLETRVIFAAAPSQDEFLSALVSRSEIDFSRVRPFHMDEYLGINIEDPASFRRYLRAHLFDRREVDPALTRLIPAESAVPPLRVCLDYEIALRAAPLDIVCGGIGENGHLAFNDPPVADFLDPVWVKVVRLDEDCRRQQVNDGCFAGLDDVPTHAYTLTIPALLSSRRLSIVVPGPRKADAVVAALRGPISEKCPASALRTHAGARIYLDRDSASGLPL